MEGITAVKPEIKRIDFERRGEMTVSFMDGRKIIVPLRYFPSIQRLTSEQRKQWTVFDGEMFSFRACNEIFHVEQLLGKESSYRYSFTTNVQQ